MKNISLKRAIDIAFFVVVILFAVLVYSTYNRAQLVTQNRLLVNHANNINDVLENVLASTVDIETGTRGFTITGDKDYLSVYRIGKENVRIGIDSLYILDGPNPTSHPKIENLQLLIQHKKEISAVTIKARIDIGMEAAAAIVKTGRGKEVMDSIRVAILDYQKDTLKMLSIGLKATDENVRARNTNFSLFTLITFLALSFAYHRLRKDAKILMKDKVIQQKFLEELTIQNQQLNEFASITSHNLRAPAANITSLVSTIDKESTIEDYQMLFGMLRTIGENLNDSLNQLMEVLHIKRNKIIDKELLSFDQICSKTTETLQGQIIQSVATITTDFSQAPEISYSRIYLESIFHNLISNAIKYRDINRKPEIHISSERKGNHTLLHFQDNGIGIDLARHGNKLFGMSQRFTNRADSKGIGLFMTKTQIETMNGKISVTSEPNVGSVFTIQFTV